MYVPNLITDSFICTHDEIKAGVEFSVIFSVLFVTNKALTKNFGKYLFARI